MTHVSWDSAARRELIEASEYYEAASAGLGRVFLQAVESAVENLGEHPRAGRRVYRKVRRSLVSRFPYSIFYRIDREPDGERLYILAIAHQKRRPGDWKKRLTP